MHVSQLSATVHPEGGEKIAPKQSSQPSHSREHDAQERGRMDPNPRLLAEAANWELATCLACVLRPATHLGRAAYGRCGPTPLPSDGARRRGRIWFVFGRCTKAGPRTMIWESPSPNTHSSPRSSPLSPWRPLYSSARRSAGGSTESATRPSS